MMYIDPQARWPMTDCLYRVPDQTPCPCCGYCPACGRRANPASPWQDPAFHRYQRPWWPDSYTPWWEITCTTTGGCPQNDTVSDTVEKLTNKGETDGQN